MAQRVDSNPRAVARKLISSQPRYDHFDTAAFRSYHVGRRPLWVWVKNRIPDIAGEIKAHIKFFSGRSVGVPEI